VRQRLLPELVSSRYGEAKASFDRKDFGLAEQQFRHVASLLDDPRRRATGASSNSSSTSTVASSP
jgi:hypothetical protein